MSSARLRTITRDDIDTIHAINQANTPEVGNVTVERLTWLVDQSAIALAAIIDQEVAGFCLVIAPGSSYGSVNYQWFATHYPEAMYLDRVAVDERYWRRGVGNALYDEVEGHIAQRPGSHELALEINVDPPNPRSLAFHDQRGFAEVGRQDTDYGVTVSLRVKVC
ncbi:MAG: GNAT family N-acetyltransferase [Ilumatobacteraceae bacterium]|nr:GNAT family N-acetyltransferase [Ilumatobacteraceae bacterium]